MKKLTLLLFGFSLLLLQVNAQVFEPEYHRDGKYSYKTVKGDPLKTRIYKLDNGLTVYLSVNKAEPRIQTYIPVRAGSKNDPADATGLAHYLEHMLFKGTDRYGSLDYKKEKKELAKVEALYETYRNTRNEEARKGIYRQIDSISGVAATYAIANEYDKMLASIGATGTNAFTSFEQTVYVNEIPANQLEKWLKIESERFRNPVFRSFHTELEAVYEEKNRSLDNDGRKIFYEMLDGLFPKHNYGQQTTIGTIEHLKNPSLKKIREYYETYYVPNNMAICLAGDLDPSATIKLIDDAFGHFQPKELPPYRPATETPLEGPDIRDVAGPDAEQVRIAWRIPGLKHEDVPALQMVDNILNNAKAGLIDLNLVKSQKVLSAYSYTMELEEHGTIVLGGRPKEGQDLEEVKDLLFEQIELIKAGEFEESLLEAIINNQEISEIQRNEMNRVRASRFSSAFTTHLDWEFYIGATERMRQVNREDIMRVANKYMGENYVLVFKRNGETQSEKVPKPSITPIEVNREAKSPFLKKITTTEVSEMAPVFLNFKEDINTVELASGVPLYYLKNEENDRFTLYYYLDMGRNHNDLLPLAVEYLRYLGTKDQSAAEISKLFYFLGSDFGVYAGEDGTYIYCDGLQANLYQTLRLFEDLLANAKADPDALQKLLERKMKSRADSKLSKYAIRQGMQGYGLYGPQNPFNNQLSNEELQKVNADDLIGIIKGLTSYEHKILYYGPEKQKEMQSILEEIHKTPEEMKKIPAPKEFKQAAFKKPIVYFVDYDMVQAEITWVSGSIPYNMGLLPMIDVYNEYYGGGMSSIVFQTIRESKALAYSTYSYFDTPDKPDQNHSLLAYVGTQADKMPEAMKGLTELLREMPKAEGLFNNAKDALKNQLETERVIREDILFSYLDAELMGHEHDLREDLYNALDKLTLSDVADFHKKYVSGNVFNVLVLGSKDKVDMNELKKYGEVKELKLEDLFGY